MSIKTFAFIVTAFVVAAVLSNGFVCSTQTDRSRLDCNAWLITIGDYIAQAGRDVNAWIGVE